MTHVIDLLSTGGVKLAIVYFSLRLSWWLFKPLVFHLLGLRKL